MVVQAGEAPKMLTPRRGPVTTETTGSGSRLTFPFRLHDMLNDAEEKQFDHIISWQGLHAFKVHDRELLERDILPLYFLQTRYKSFSRQRKFCDAQVCLPFLRRN
jgi:HSF-type DNA-binding